MNKGYEIANFCEIDPYASTSYVAIHGVDPALNLGDITKVDRVNPFTAICGGSPCFAKGTFVLTDNGYKEIENISCGDRVLTHKGRFMPVLKTGKDENKEIFCLKAQGFLPIYCTEDHPFYVKRAKDLPPEKIRLNEMKPGYYVGSNINENSKNEYGLTNELCWILGRYVADGHVRKDKRKNRKDSYIYQLILSIGKNKLENLKDKIKDTKYSCYEHGQSTYRVSFSSMQLVNFVLEHGFGTCAKDKRIPQFIIDLPHDKLESFFDGYISGDGCTIVNDEGETVFQATTISRELAISLSHVVQKLYRVGCRVYFDERPQKYMICGREVNQNDTYMIRFMKTYIKHSWFIDGDIVWYPVKKIEKTDRVEDVYNIEVAEDHTYTANNVITFNCQDFSISGNQEGSKWHCNDCGHEYNPLTVDYRERERCPHCGSTNLDKTRSSLLVEWLRIIRENSPKWGIYENVKNIVGTKFKETFDMFIKELDDYGYNTYWKVLNAKDFGVPQNRERVYLILVRKDLDNGKFKFPDGFESDICLADVLDDDVEEKYYVDTPRAKELIDELIASGKLNDQYGE